MILWYYMSFIQQIKTGKTKEAQQFIQQILQQSLGGGSQLMTFEVKI